MLQSTAQALEEQISSEIEAGQLDDAFEDLTEQAGIDRESYYGLGVVMADYDNDGLLDLIKGNFSDDSNNPCQSNGGRTFTDVACPARLGEVSWPFTTFGAKFPDNDNDGWKDILAVEGQTFPQMDRYPTGIMYAERKLLFHNRGDGRFEEVGRESGPGLAPEKASRGVAVADCDNDGDLEVIVSNMSDRPDLLCRTRKDGNHSVAVRTIGTHSDRNGIGTKITVVCAGRQQYDEVRTGGGYVSSSGLRVHFGLAGAARVDRLELHWPSGQTGHCRKCTGHLLTVQESRDLIGSKPFRKARSRLL